MNSEPITRDRLFFRISVGALAVSFWAMLVYAMVFAYPAILTTGDANVQAWVGPDRARVVYLALSGGILLAYIGVTLLGTQGDQPAAVVPWRTGSLVGAGFGLLGVLFVVGLDAVITTSSGSGLSFVVPYILTIIGPLLAGAVTASATGSFRLALLAGFWCGLVVALLLAVGGFSADLIFARRLELTAWPGSVSGPGCQNAAGTVLAACALGDNLGGWANQLLSLPLGAALFGGLAGLFGRLAARNPLPVSAAWPRIALAPAFFIAFLMVIFIPELLFNLF